MSIRTVRVVRIRSVYGRENLKTLRNSFAGDGMCLALLSVCHSERNVTRSEPMVRMIKKVGDRELAWVMLAIAAVALWSTWGLSS